MQSDPRQQLLLVIKELGQRKLLIVTTFVFVSMAGVLVGANWPKVYRSSTTIHVESRNIIDPLMQGRAVRPDMSNQTENAREIINSRSLLVKVLRESGQITEETSPAEEEQLIEALRQRITTTMPGENLIRIEYRDSEARRTYETTRDLAEIFVQEMLAAQERESSAAFHFIDRQVKEYEEQLQQTQEELTRLREENPDAQPGAEQQVSQRISNLQNTIDGLEQSLQEARIRERSLEEQLSGEAATSRAATRAEQQRQRIAELESELDSLRLRYQETHPDIVAIKQQIDDLEARAERMEADGEGQGSTQQTAAGRDNPVYQELQQGLYEVRTEKQTIQARLSDARKKLDASQSRATRVQQVQATVEKLMQDYEVNQDTYEDLLRRRENARVSMNLDNEQQGLALRVQEPAYLPHQTSGPRPLHFALGGLVLGGALPFGLLFGLIMIDPRVRAAESLPESARATLLDTIPRMRTKRDRRRERVQVALSVFVVILAIAGSAAVLILSRVGGA